MDLVTQGILGAAVGQAAGFKRLGRKAIVAGMIGGFLPDLDVICKFFFTNGEMLYHRGFTHSLWFGPVFGTFLGYILHQYYKKSLISWIRVMVLSLLTHPLLDLFTVYGTQLFAPFSNQRFSIPAVPIIDPFYSIPLLIAPLYGYLRPKKRFMAQLIAMVLLTASTGYLVWGYRHNCLAETYARESLLNTGITVQRLHAFPTLLQIYLRRIIAYSKTRNGQKEVRVGYLSTWNLDQNPEIIWHIKPLPEDEGVNEVLRHPMTQLFMWFAEQKVCAERIQESVYIRDLRYGLPGMPIWGLWSMIFTPSPSGWHPSFERFPLSFQWSMIGKIYAAAFGSVDNMSLMIDHPR